MPSIFHRLQRRGSRPSTAKPNGKHIESYQAEHANAQNGNGVSQRKSSSTINSSHIGSSDPSITPATSTTEDINGPTPLPVRSPTRAQRPGVDPLKRYSMNVGASKFLFNFYTDKSPGSRFIWLQWLPELHEQIFLTRTACYLRLRRLMGRLRHGLA
jgi:hypothetical protein